MFVIFASKTSSLFQVYEIGYKLAHNQQSTEERYLLHIVTQTSIHKFCHAVSTNYSLINVFFFPIYSGYNYFQERKSEIFHTSKTNYFKVPSDITEYLQNFPMKMKQLTKLSNKIFQILSF